MVIKMIIDYDRQKLRNALLDFYNATGIAINLLQSDFSPLHIEFDFMRKGYCSLIQSTAIGKEKCRLSDIKLLEKCRESKKAEMHICHAGLIDVAVPIIYNTMVIGYIILGQMRSEKSFSFAEKLISELSLDTREMATQYNLLSIRDDEKIKSVSNLAVMLVQYILLEKMLKPNYNINIEKAMNFINENLEKPLSVDYITNEINISKSALYKYFHEFMNCTVSEYINIKRVEKAVELLTETSLPVGEISQKVGYSSAAYFTKIFKNNKGISPLHFRMKHKNKI